MARRPDPKAIPLLLDGRTSGRESILSGLVRAIVALLLGGRSGSPERLAAEAAGLSRTAASAAGSLAWQTLDAIAGETTRGQVPAADIADDYWADLIDQAIEDGIAENMAAIQERADDLIAAAERAAVQAHGDATGDSDDPVTGYRRVPHPELSLGGTCGLCLTASHRIYSRGDLEKIHPGCHCTVTEVRASYDPGDILNNLDLGDIYDLAKTTSDRSRLSHVRVIRGADGDLIFVDRNGQPLDPATLVAA